MPAAFIVDGDMEKRIVQRICPKHTRVLPHRMNGKSVPIETVAEAIASLVRLMKDDHYPIFILAEREGRDIESHELQKLLELEVRKRIQGQAEIIFFVPDRMIENWIVADLMAKGSIPLFENQLSADGLNGVAILKKHLDIYHKTTTGVELFCQIDCAKAVKFSPILTNFVRSVSAYCHWARIPDPV